MVGLQLAVAPKGFEEIVVRIDYRNVDLGVVGFMARRVFEQEIVVGSGLREIAIGAKGSEQLFGFALVFPTGILA